MISKVHFVFMIYCLNCISRERLKFRIDLNWRSRPIYLFIMYYKKLQVKLFNARITGRSKQKLLVRHLGVENILYEYLLHLFFLIVNYILSSSKPNSDENFLLWHSKQLLNWYNDYTAKICHRLLNQYLQNAKMTHWNLADRKR